MQLDGDVLVEQVHETLVRVAPEFPPSVFAGESSWSSSALAGLQQRWVDDRLDAGGELEAIAAHATGDDHRAALLERSLRDLLAGTGSRRLLAHVETLVRTSDAFVRAGEDAWSVSSGGSSNGRTPSLRRIVRAVSDVVPPVYTYRGVPLGGSSLVAEEDLAGFVKMVLREAGGPLTTRRLQTVVAHALGVPARLDVSSPPPAVHAEPAEVAHAVMCAWNALDTASRDDALVALVAARAQTPEQAEVAHREVERLVAEAGGANDAAHAEPPPPRVLARIARRRAHDRPWRARRTEVWATAAVGGASVDVLILDDGQETLLSLRHSAVVVDTRVACATWLEPILEPEDSTLEVAMRVRLGDQLLVRREDLDVRIGQLTGFGEEALTRVELGLLPDERFGPPPGPATTKAQPDAVDGAAVAALAVVPAPAEPSETEIDDVAIAGDPEAGWPRQIDLSEEVTAVIDLLDVTTPPAVLLYGRRPEAKALAARVRTQPDAAEAARRLVVAEARVAARPYGLFVIDSAVAAKALLTHLAEQAADATTLTSLWRRRADQAMERLDRLPTFAVRATPRKLRGELAAAVADFEHALAGTAAAARARSLLERLRDPEVERASRAPDTVKVGDLATAPRTARLPVDLDLRVVDLAEEPPMVDVIDEGTGTLALRLPLRLDVADADAESPHALELLLRGAGRMPQVWVQLFDTATRRVLHSALLRRDGDELVGALPGSLDAGGILVRRRPTRVVELEALRLEALLAAKHDRPWVAHHLLAVARQLATPGEQVDLLRVAWTMIDRSAPGTLAGGIRKALANVGAANAAAAPAGPAPETLCQTVEAWLRRARDVRADHVWRGDDPEDALRDLRALDDLLH